MSSRRLAGAAVTLTLVVALGGCAGGAADVELHQSDGHTIAVARGSGAGGDASVAGKLVLSKDSCWGVEQADGTFLLVIWPEGTSDDKGQVTVSGLSDNLAIGDELRLSGGDVSTEEMTAVAERCNEDSAFQAWEVSKEG